MNGVMLAHYGIVLPTHAVVSTQFLVQSEKSTELLREFNPTGIYYKEEESLKVMLRIFFYDAYRPLLEMAGATIHGVPKTGNEVANGAEDEEESEGETLAATSLGFAEGFFYVEYPLSMTVLDESSDLLTNHPTFVKRYNHSEKNASVFDSKLEKWATNIAALGPMGSLEPSEELEDDGDEALTGAPAITQNSIAAQANAHRSHQNNIRERLSDILTFFEQKVIKSGVVVESIGFAEAKERYESMGEVLSHDTLLADMADELIPVGKNAITNVEVDEDND